MPRWMAARQGRPSRTTWARSTRILAPTISTAPTAIVNSLTKVDHSLATNGTLMNLRFPQEAVAGIEGPGQPGQLHPGSTSTKGPCTSSSISCSAATMRAAQKKPEDYKDMLIPRGELHPLLFGAGQAPAEKTSSRGPHFILTGNTQVTIERHDHQKTSTSKFHRTSSLAWAASEKAAGDLGGNHSTTSFLFWSPVWNRSASSKRCKHHRKPGPAVHRATAPTL